MVRIQSRPIIFKQLNMNKLRLPSSRAETRWIAFAPALLLLFLSANLAACQHVILVPTPVAGIQPQAALDSKVVVHLIYFNADPIGSNLFYVRRDPSHDEFSNPM